MLAGFQLPSLPFIFSFHVVFYSFSQTGLVRTQTLNFRTTSSEFANSEEKNT